MKAQTLAVEDLRTKFQGQLLRIVFLAKNFNEHGLRTYGGKNRYFRGIQ